MAIINGMILVHSLCLCCMSQEEQLWNGLLPFEMLFLLLFAIDCFQWYLWKHHCRQHFLIFPLASFPNGPWISENANLRCSISKNCRFPDTKIVEIWLLDTFCKWFNVSINCLNKTDNVLKYFLDAKFIFSLYIFFSNFNLNFLLNTTVERQN